MMKIAAKLTLALGITAAVAAGTWMQTAHAEQPYPLVQQGTDLAEMWCNACHVTGTGVSESALDAAPPFRTLAPLVAGNPEYYRGFLTNPHYPMRDISLSRAEIAALLAYIQSLNE